MPAGKVPCYFSLASTKWIVHHSLMVRLADFWSMVATFSPQLLFWSMLKFLLAPTSSMVGKTSSSGEVSSATTYASGACLKSSFQVLMVNSSTCLFTHSSTWDCFSLPLPTCSLMLVCSKLTEKSPAGELSRNTKKSWSKWTPSSRIVLLSADA